MKKTVLFLIDDYNIGGVTTFVKQYVDGLIQKKVSVIVLGFKSNIDDEIHFYKDAETIVINTKVELGLLGRLKSALIYLKYLNNIFRNNDITSIHFSLAWSTFYSLMHPKTWLLHKTCTFYGAYHLESASIHNNPRLNVSGRLFNYVRKQSRMMMQKIMLSVSDKIITFSQYAKKIILDEFSNSYDSKIVIIPGLISHDQIINFKETTGFSKRGLRILSFGRLEPRKGIDHLLRAAALLGRNGVMYKLVIAGPHIYGELERCFDVYEENNLFDKVQFVHKVNSQQINKLLKWADVFIMPSVDLETFGMTMIESLSKGVPVIGFPTGAIPEVLGKFNKNMITKSPTSLSLYRKISTYSKLTSYKKMKLSRQGVLTVKRFFTLDKNVINDLYQLFL